MPREDWMSSLPRPIPQSGDRFPVRQVWTFRKEGEVLTVGYGSEHCGLKDTKGVAYLAHLIRHPGSEFHVLIWSGESRPTATSTCQSAAAEDLPRRAEELEKAGCISPYGTRGASGFRRASYGALQNAVFPTARRTTESREGIENVERAERAEQEIDALTRNSRDAVGPVEVIGGRRQPGTGPAEHSQQAITVSNGRIAQSDTALGYHLLAMHQDRPLGSYSA